MDVRVYCGIILIASFFEMWSAGTICDAAGSDGCKDEYQFAVWLGVISLAIALVQTALFVFAGDMANKTSPVFAIILFLWWVIGVMVVTFKKPFSNACFGSLTSSTNTATFTFIAGVANGFFATWLCCAAAWFWMCEAVPKVLDVLAKAAPSGEDSSLMSLLLGASIVEMAQASYYCGMDGGGSTGCGDDTSADCAQTCSSDEAWGVCLGVFSCFLVLLMTFVGALAPYKKFICAFLSIWWFTGVATVTFYYHDNRDLGIFTSTGNGFFSTWVAAFVSCALCYMNFAGGGAPEGGESSDAGAGGSLSDPRVALGVVFTASFFEMWAAGAYCDNYHSATQQDCSDYYGYAVALGVISLVICIIQMALYMFASGVAGTASPFTGGFLTLWWLAGVAVCTFKEPFTSGCANTGYGSSANGYFGCWIAFAGSAAMLAQVPQVQALASKAASSSGADGSMLGALLLTSLIVMAQASYDCDDRTDGCTDALGWAVAAGVISIVFVLVCMLVSAVSAYKGYIYAFLAVWWGCATCTLTFYYKDNTDLGVYTVLGNGFMGCWASFFIAFVLAYVGLTGAELSLGGGGAGEGGEGGDAGAAPAGAPDAAPAPDAGKTTDEAVKESEEPKSEEPGVVSAAV